MTPKYQLGQRVYHIAGTGVVMGMTHFKRGWVYTIQTITGLIVQAEECDLAI